MNNFLWEDGSTEWTFDILNRTFDTIYKLNDDELKLDIYPNQIEMVTSEQMLDAYASVGLPIMYKHWSFGKTFIRESKAYAAGNRGLALEMVLNTNPCINFLMEDNSIVSQALVACHAAVGHNNFFHDNYLFKQYTQPEAIVDYLVFARNYITECEEKYGEQAVERTLDSLHALQQYGVDKYNKPKKLSLVKEKERQRERQIYIDSQVNQLWNVTIKKPDTVKNKKFPEHPEENLLYFIEKHSPVLEPWQREITRIVRKIATYFRPQSATKISNEGWASFVHHHMMNRLWEKGHIGDGSWLEFMSLHTNVLYQPGFDSKYYSGLNPYCLGFEIFSDIKRICQDPDDEDKHWFPNIAGQDWLETCREAVANYNDESFIRQFLGPKVIKKMRLFQLSDIQSSDKYHVDYIHNDDGMRMIRSNLANNKELDQFIPKIEIIEADLKNDRTLTLMYYSKNGRSLSSDTTKVMKHIHNLWGYPVRIVDENNKQLYHYPG